MKNQIHKLFIENRYGKRSRRSFIRQLAMITGSSAAALSIIPVMEENELRPGFNGESNSDLITEFIKYPGFTGDMMAFLARPVTGNKFPAVLVIHENRGLVPHIQDVTRRMAGEGVLAIAPDAISPGGGTPDVLANVGVKLHYSSIMKKHENTLWKPR
jgi:carboxymethylenebutenolidase